jgi:hypothetical protein
MLFIVVTIMFNNLNKSATIVSIASTQIEDNQKRIDVYYDYIKTLGTGQESMSRQYCNIYKLIIKKVYQKDFECFKLNTINNENTK